MDHHIALRPLSWLVTLFAAILASSALAQGQALPSATTQATQTKRSTTTKLTTGEVLYPEEGETVGRAIPVTVRILNPKPESYYWVSVKIGSLHWPKEPALTMGDLDDSGEATVIAHEGGVARELELVLLDCTERVHNKFRRWIENGHRTGSYPGLHYPPRNATELDAVGVRLSR